MGCHMTKVPSSGAPRPQAAASLPKPSATILTSRSVELGPSSAMVVKPAHANKVFALPDVQGTQSVEIRLPGAKATQSVEIRDGGGILAELDPPSKQQELVLPRPIVLQQGASSDSADIGKTGAVDERPTLLASISMQRLTDMCCQTAPRASTRKTKSTLCDCFEEEEPPKRRKRSKGAEPGAKLEQLIVELFRAHDLNGDAMLDENELIQLNEAVAEVHGDQNVDREAIKTKYSELFRKELDQEGRPVGYDSFRTYMLRMLEQIDSHEDAQEMMVEQFLAEARLARSVVLGAPIMADMPKRGCYQDCLNCCQSNAASEALASDITG